ADLPAAAEAARLRAEPAGRSPGADAQRSEGRGRPRVGGDRGGPRHGKDMSAALGQDLRAGLERLRDALLVAGRLRALALLAQAPQRRQWETVARIEERIELAVRV